MVWRRCEAGSEQGKNITEERNLAVRLTPVWSKTQAMCYLNSHGGKKGSDQRQRGSFDSSQKSEQLSSAASIQ